MEVSKWSWAMGFYVARKSTLLHQVLDYSSFITLEEAIKFPLKGMQCIPSPQIPKSYTVYIFSKVQYLINISLWSQLKRAQYKKNTLFPSSLILVGSTTNGPYFPLHWN
jgi:hypothetical protein